MTLALVAVLMPTGYALYKYSNPKLIMGYLLSPVASTQNPKFEKMKEKTISETTTKPEVFQITSTPKAIDGKVTLKLGDVITIKPEGVSNASTQWNTDTKAMGCVITEESTLNCRVIAIGSTSISLTKNPLTPEEQNSNVIQIEVVQ